MVSMLLVGFEGQRFSILPLVAHPARVLRSSLSQALFLSREARRLSSYFPDVNAIDAMSRTVE
ncbi:hypothetical protein [Caballeronia sp. GAFFF1]|uniref:hypothetical protein n=1 Tax=Caballeronia sp. GAFFF1 TaxID=2921779 RepID=UPI0020279D7C|nr:hypothetical protein [Caballeronia sp. GAFFF1]